MSRKAPPATHTLAAPPSANTARTLRKHCKTKGNVPSSHRYSPTEPHGEPGGRTASRRSASHLPQSSSHAAQVSRRTGSSGRTVTSHTRRTRVATLLDPHGSAPLRHVTHRAGEVLWTTTKTPGSGSGKGRGAPPHTVTSSPPGSVPTRTRNQNNYSTGQLRRGGERSSLPRPGTRPLGPAASGAPAIAGPLPDTHACRHRSSGLLPLSSLAPRRPRLSAQKKTGCKDKGVGSHDCQPRQHVRPP